MEDFDAKIFEQLKMKLTTAVVSCMAALALTTAPVEAYGRGPGFIGSTFRHSVNNLRPEVQETNRNAVQGAFTDTFKSPADIPTNKVPAYGTAVQFGGNLHKNGYGSQGMGTWWDEMDDGEEEYDHHQLFQPRIVLEPFIKHRQLKGKHGVKECLSKCREDECKKERCLKFKRRKGVLKCVKRGISKSSCLKCQKHCVLF